MENVITYQRARFTLITLCLIVILLVALRLYMLSYLYTQSMKLSDCQFENNKLTIENDMLKRKLLTEESYSTISYKAKQMGFIPATYIYLK